MNPPSINHIQKELYALKSKYEVVLFGSAVEGGFRYESDIDIAVLSRNSDKAKNQNLQLRLLQDYGMNYDIHVFELLPIIIQASIFENYNVIFGGILEISEYFYGFRKRWDDCKHRIIDNQFSSFRERLAILDSHRELL
ncbi:MAG: nucleotidyltransferase domain-containing protein [Promethearchaeota archaeon]